MQVKALTQPDTNEISIGEAVVEALRWTDAQAAWFAVAWAKRSGLDILEQPIRDLRRRRRAVQALIGVDQHGATEEALRQALDLFTEARVYHDAARFKTFHPKLYVVEGNKRARVIAGSGNLTEGGLSINYELGIQLDLNLNEAADAALLGDYRRWFDLRWSNRDASRKLTATLIKKLMKDPTVVVVREADVPPIPGPPGSRRSDEERVFGPAVKGLRSRRSKPKSNDSDASDAVTPGSRNGRSGTTTTGGQSRSARGTTGAATTSSTATSTRRAPSDLVLAAGLPKDRPGQAGFNADVTRDFFEVSNNGDKVFAEAVDLRGGRHGMRQRSLVFPVTTNGNHRIELRDPDGRTRPANVWPIVLVRKLGRRQFRYRYLYPGDAGYASMTRQLAQRDGIGRSIKPQTKRVYLTLAEVKKVWPACPL